MSAACDPVELRPAPLEVSLNGQDYTTAALQFVTYAAPEPASLSPSSGPSGGGTLVTLRGAHLTGGSDYRCRFGAGPLVANPRALDGGA